jgi:hypothetical protein
MLCGRNPRTAAAMAAREPAEPRLRIRGDSQDRPVHHAETRKYTLNRCQLSLRGLSVTSSPAVPAVRKVSCCPSTVARIREADLWSVHGRAADGPVQETQAVGARASGGVAADESQPGVGDGLHRRRSGDWRMVHPQRGGCLDERVPGAGSRREPRQWPRDAGSGTADRTQQRLQL